MTKIFDRKIMARMTYQLFIEENKRVCIDSYDL